MNDGTSADPPGIVASPVSRLHGGQVDRGDDWLAQESPVALVFNGITYAVMLATPADLEDFAFGFAWSEGLLDHPREFYGAEAVDTPDGIELRIDVAGACAERLKRRRRSLATSLPPALATARRRPLVFRAFFSW